MPENIRRPAHPERICWGCERHCPAHDLFCGEDKMRAPHPSELFGEDWESWATADRPTALDADLPAEERAATG
jgi:hypothetical protein